MLANTYAVDGLVVIVTGAGSGIGRSIARAFLSQGSTVVVAGRREEPLHETIDGFDRSLVVTTDIGERADVDALVARTIDEFGRIDVVVSNAGAYAAGPLDELGDDDWERLRSTNIDSLVYLARAATPHLIASGGNLVAVSSVSGMRGDWGQAAYNATKGAINAFVQSLALDLGASGVRVNAVAPAFTQTEMTEAVTDLDPFVNRIALGRPGRADDIPPAVLFLASPDAAYLTGVILPVDGGTSASTGQPHV